MIRVEKYTSTISDGTEKEFERIIVHRGDKGALYWNIELFDGSDYNFKVGDIVDFTVFEKKGYDKTPVINKTIEVSESSTKVEIDLTEEDTTIGEPINKATTYWYEISLNRDVVNGYDYDEGPMEFILLPGKAGDTE